MKTVMVPYAGSFEEVTVDSPNVDAVYPEDSYNRDEESTLAKAFSSDSFSRKYHDFFDVNDTLLVIVNDHARPTPTGRILDCLQDKINPSKTEFLVATGSHRSPNEYELHHIFGKHYDVFKQSIHIHDSKREEELEYIGRTSRGTDLSINRRYLSAGKILIIGSVEPHYFAGFTGGRKAILPGITGYETITGNHRLSLQPGSENLRLEGNPVNDDIMEALDLLPQKRILSIQVVLDKDHKIHSIHSGNLEESFKIAVEDARRMFTVRIKEMADIVIAVATNPLDIDLYQAHKALENSRLAVKDGGIIILVSECRDGIGPDTFYRLMQSTTVLEEARKAAETDYNLGYHKVVKIYEILLDHKIFAVTKIGGELVRNMKLIPFQSLQSAIDEAINKKGKNPRILFNMDASITVLLPS